MKDRVMRLMSVVFEIDSKDIPENAAPGIIEQWDSLRHLQLIVSLEEEFNIQFTDSELVGLIDIPSILATVTKNEGK
jgi:acyl carrier protein